MSGTGQHPRVYIAYGFFADVVFGVAVVGSKDTHAWIVKQPDVWPPEPPRQPLPNVDEGK